LPNSAIPRPPNRAPPSRHTRGEPILITHRVSVHGAGFRMPADRDLSNRTDGRLPKASQEEGIALIVIQTTLRANASRTAAQAASRRRARLSDRLPTGRAAALSHRKSPDRPMCSQPTGEVWECSGQAGCRPRSSRSGLWLVHRRLRHARSERGQSPARRAGLMRMLA
jgi:hypothetical protein